MASRASASIKVNLGLMSMEGGIHAPAKTEAKQATQFHNACRQCMEERPDDAPEPVQQRYTCSHEHGPFLPSDVVKYKENEDGVPVFVGTNEEVKDIKVDDDIEKGVLDLNVHPISQVEAETFPGEKCWVFLPKSEKDKLYGILLDCMTDTGAVDTPTGDYALVGEIRVRDQVYLVRLDREGSQLVVRQLLRPEDFKEFPELDVVPNDKNNSMLRQLIEISAEDFDGDAYKDDVKERVKNFMEARSSGVTLKTTPRKSSKDPDADMEAMLQAALAAAKDKKSA